MMAEDALLPPLQAFLQILLAEKAMGESRAKAVLDECAAKFGQRLPAYDACLRSANVNLDLLGMALEGIKLVGEEEAAICISNKVGDEVAKEFGGMFGKDWQVEGFKKIVVLFAKEAKEEADDGVISIDIERHLLRGIRAANVTLEVWMDWVAELVDMKWLKAIGSKHIRLGARTYLELQDLLKSNGIHIPPINPYLPG